jgi:hypothetical protein
MRSLFIGIYTTLSTPQLTAFEGALLHKCCILHLLKLREISFLLLFYAVFTGNIVVRNPQSSWFPEGEFWLIVRFRSITALTFAAGTPWLRWLAPGFPFPDYPAFCPADSGQLAFFANTPNRFLSLTSSFCFVPGHLQTTSLLWFSLQTFVYNTGYISGTVVCAFPATNGLGFWSLK